MTKKETDHRELYQEKIDGILDALDAGFQEELKDWICRRWPHGIGLYD